MKSVALLLFIASPIAARTFIGSAYGNMESCQQACPGSCDYWSATFLNCTDSRIPGNAYCNCMDKSSKKK